MLEMNTNSKTLLYLASWLIVFSIFVSAGYAQTVDIAKIDYSKIDSSAIPLNLSNYSTDRITGSVFRISGEELRKNPTNDLMQALSGKIPGFISLQESNTPGAANYNNMLRGKTPIILLNGIPRDIVIDLKEIEEVIVYKDFSAAAMYGDIGANGIVNVITKKGSPGSRKIEAEYQYGINSSLNLPQYPGAYEAAKMYNQARQNDGLSPIFDNEALNAFQNKTNSFRYPDVDYYGEYLRSNTPQHNLTTTFMGGDSTIQYYLHGGWQSNQGLESIGERLDYNRMLLRSDLDIQLNDMVGINIGITGWMDITRNASMGSEEMFDIMSSYPAYAIPMQSGDSAFIVNRDYPSNLLSKMTAEGFSRAQKRTVNFNLGLDFNLNKFIKGLSMNGYISIDSYNELVEGTRGNPFLYEPEYVPAANGEDSLVLNVYQYETKDTDISHVSDDINRQYTFYSKLNYERQFSQDHLFNASVLYFQNALERRGKTGDIKSQMINSSINYSFKGKYVFDGYLLYTGTQKLIGDNKFKLSSGLGLAWIASSEPFLENVGFINHLKLRASLGSLGLINTSEYYVYRDAWYSWDNVQFGTKDKNSDYDTYILEQTGNPDANWPVMRKFNVGMDGSIFNNSLRFTVDFYQNTYTGQLERLMDFRSGMEGNYRFIPLENYNETKNLGIESGFSYSDDIADFSYVIGVNFSYGKETYSKVAELNYSDSYRLMNGQPADAIWGLEADGLFRNNDEISQAPTQMFGEVNPGDIRYKDQNGDNIIDEKDYKVIGNSVPDYMLGGFIQLAYKGFGLYVQGASTFGHNLVLDNGYYRNFGLDKYSVIMQNDYPRLSSLGSSNNFRSSDYWIANGGFFRLKTVELSYDLPSLFSRRSNSGLTIFVRGNNLLTFSGFKELDPENINAGVTGYPLFKTIAIGLSIKL
jgi:TonB-dependent starch-binding outer membrane protein SusC